jgi:phosphate transport system ATP-binding protein
MSERAVHPKIDIQDVSFTYSSGTQALKPITMDVRPNEIMVLFGPALSGKTTLLRLLNRLSDLTEGATVTGQILFNNRNIFDPTTHVATLRRQISMVFALPTPLPGTIRDNLIYGLKMAGVKDELLYEERIERSLRQAALWDEVKDRLNHSATALSGGQQQRLCIARSLALEPQVLLLDNPTSGLDPLSTGMVEESLHELKKQYTIIIVPHSIQQAARLADRAALLLDGELADLGFKDEIFVNPVKERTENYVTGRFG